MNLVQIQERLKDMPAQALMAYANGMNPDVPPYLALGELNRRKQMEQKMQTAQAPQGTVKDQIEGEVGLMALKKQVADQMALGGLRQQQMAQGQAAQSAMMPQAVPVGAPEPEMQEEMEMAGGGITSIIVPDNVTEYGSGGIVAFAKGGDEGEEKNEKESKKDKEELADQIPGQRYTAPAPTGRMTGEMERNIMNTMAALPGASVMRAAPTGVRALAPYIASLTGVQEPVPEIERGRPTMPNDPRIVTPRNVEPEIERGRPTMQNDPRLSGIAAFANRMAPPAAPRAAGVPGAVQAAMTQMAPAAQPAQAAPAMQAAPAGYEKMLMDMATGAGRQSYAERRAEAEKADPYLAKQPGEMMEQYLQRMEARQAQEQGRFDELEKERARAALWKSLIAAGEASRGTRGIGALMAGFGKTAGEELEAGRAREEGRMKARREFEDNMAKMRQEIENARIARAQGKFKEANEHDQKSEDYKRDAIKAGAQIQAEDRRTQQKFANEQELAKIRFEYDRRLKAIPPAERPSLEREYVEELVKAGVPRTQAIERARMLGAAGTKGVMTRDQAEDNFRKDMENYATAAAMKKEAQTYYGREPSYSEMKEYYIQKQMGASAGAAPTGGVARPQTQAEFNKIPSGSRYINPADGKEYIKK